MAIARKPTDLVGTATTNRRGVRPTWKWVLGAVVVAFVVWQVAQGVFVKSPSVLGAGETWKWIVGAVVVAFVVWQVAQGVFVKSVSVPGAGKISFFPKHEDDTNATNTVDQSGSENQADIYGRNNIVQQRGHGNKAIIGGNPVSVARLRADMDARRASMRADMRANMDARLASRGAAIKRKKMLDPDSAP